MAIQNTLYISFLSALIAMAGAPVAIAGDPGAGGSDSGDPTPGEEEECTNTETPEICDAVWCHAVNVGCLAFIHPPADHIPIPQEDLDELLECLNTPNDTHKNCMAKVCKDKYILAQAYPTYDQCANRWAQEKVNCNNASHFCGTSYAEGMHPDLRAPLRAACRKAADNRYKACSAAAKPSYDPGNGGGGGSRGLRNAPDGSLLDGLHGNEVFSSRSFVPAEGRNVAAATWTPLPGVGESIHSMQLILVLPDYTKGVILYGESILPDQDGMYTLELSADAIDRFNGIDHISMMILWKNSEEVAVWGEPMEFAIAETDIPGDFDRNGRCDVSDLPAFLTAYDMNTPRADRNGDMVVNAADLALFLAEYDGE